MFFSLDMDAQTQTEARHWGGRADLTVQVHEGEGTMIRYRGATPRLLTSRAWTPSKKKKHPRKKNMSVHLAEATPTRLDIIKTFRSQGCGTEQTAVVTSQEARPRISDPMTTPAPRKGKSRKRLRPAPNAYVRGLLKRKREMLREKMRELFGSDSEEERNEVMEIQISTPERQEMDAINA